MQATRAERIVEELMRADLVRVGRMAQEHVKLRPEDIPAGRKIEPGVRSDAVKAVGGGWAPERWIKPPARRNDGTARWYYEHATLVHHFSDGHWRVKAIEPPVEKKRSKGKRRKGGSKRPKGGSR